MKRAIINASSNNRWYAKGQNRLLKSLAKYQEHSFDIHMKLGEEKVNAPPHDKCPYGYKPFALDWLRKQGYTQVIWLDASFWAVKSLEPLWEYLETNGWLMEESGHYLNQWCNDRALKNMGITREQAKAIPMYSAGMTGLNLDNYKANNFLNDWLAFAKDGETFSGDKSNHRHDMSVASYLAHKYDMKYNSGGRFMAYIGKVYGKPKDSVFFHLAGM